MADRGLAYGPAFQVLDDLHRGPDAAVARVVLPASVVREAGRYRLHPALGDALLQSMAEAVPLEADGSFSPFTYMPVGVRRVRVVRPVEDFSEPLFTYARRTSDDASASPERVEGDVLLVNEAGDVLVAFEGVAVQRLGRSEVTGEADATSWLYRVAWQPAPLSDAEGGWRRGAAEPPAGAWLIFADSQGVGRQLADRLSQQGQTSVLVEAGSKFQWTDHESGNGKPRSHTTARLDPLDEAHYRQLFEKAFLQQNRPCLGVAHLWSLDIPKPDRVPGAPLQSREGVWQTSRQLGTGSALQLLRSLARMLFSQAPPVWFVTAGAQSVEGRNSDSLAIEQAPLLGLARVAALEHPDLQPRLVDLDPAAAATAAAGDLCGELISASSDGEIAYRGGERYAARLVRDASVLADAPAGDELSIPAGKPFQLRITKAGSFDALRYVPVQREPPAAGQVEIEVRATGLNFSDVLKALGLYPGIKDQIVPLGIEASGVVTAVGPGVDRFRVGEEVLGVVPYAFASHARTAEYALVAKPASLDHDEACTIPITFLTAYYALVHLAHLQPGERVLIHAGAGGVGLAAIQIAQQIGAEVFATAGSDEKRDFLRALGVRHVYNSRTLEFAAQILADTDRQGVDVVLNSLPGEAITKSLSILRAYGRFLEIGKIDIYQNRMIGLLPFQDNLSYFAIDLDRMLRQRPEQVRGLFAEVMQHFTAGHYEPLLFTRFEAEATIDAFRYMSQRKNIGKVVVSLESQESRVKSQEPDGEAASAASVSVARKDGTYLVTGGLGALGLQVAEWLAGEGAGTIALLSRRGASEEVADQLAAIQAKGARVIVLQGDVTDAASLQSALKQLPAAGPPLRGVVHAAGVLADGVLADMTLEQLDRAVRPKAQGAWNLHTATTDAPLDWFAMFSSVASVLGSPGQANYAAGNAALDALAAYRRARGLPATTINWGPWSGAGMAVEAGRGEAVQSRGMGLLPPDRALDLLGKLLRSDVTQIAVMDAQWDDMLRLMGARRPALLADIAAEVEQAGGTATASRVDRAFLDQLLAVDQPARHALVSDYIRDELARIMGVESENLDADKPLSTFGLDSLLALELKNNLEGRLDFTLPMAKLMEGPSITSLAQETIRLVAGGDRAAAAAAAEADLSWTPLLALRATGARPPLVLLPALGGDVSCYGELVEQLGPDQPVYAFRPRGVDQEIPPHRTMDEMIDAYAGALHELQPTGPYYLAGWSTGGIFAFALAEALQQAGEEVALVALLDTPLPSICDQVDVNDDTRFLCVLVNFANCFAGTKIRLDYDALAPLSPSAQFQVALAEARRLGTVPAEVPESFIRRLVLVGQANVQVIQSYRPQSLKQAVHLFVPRTKGGLAEIAGKDLPEAGDHGWNDEVGQQVELHEVPGDHFSMLLGDGAAHIARQLDALLTMHVAGQSR